MKYAFSTNAYTSYSLTDAIWRIRDCGFNAVEILADAPHAFPPGNIEELKLVSKVLEKTEAVVCNINANTAVGLYPSVLNTGEVIFEPSLCNRDPDIRQLRLEYTKRCIDLADFWGSYSICITSGRCLPGNTPEEAYGYFIASLHTLLDYATRRNIRIGIEYEPGLLIENADEVEKLIQELRSPLLGVNLDVGHAAVLGEPLAATIYRFQGRIWNIHVEDIRGRKHYHLIPGQGDIDFGAVIQALQQSKYDRYVTMELYTYTHCPDEAARESLRYMSQFQTLE